MAKLGIPARMKMMALIQEGYGCLSRVGNDAYLEKIIVEID